MSRRPKIEAGEFIAEANARSYNMETNRTPARMMSRVTAHLAILSFGPTVHAKTRNAPRPQGFAPAL